MQYIKSESPDLTATRNFGDSTRACTNSKMAKTRFSKPKTSPSESTISSSSPESLTTSLTYLSALEVMVLQTGGKICEIQDDMVLGTFFTKTVKAFKTAIFKPVSVKCESSGILRPVTRASVK